MHLCAYSKRLPLQYCIKSYGISIHVENFIFKEGGCIRTAKRIYDIPGTERKIFDILISINFNFDEISVQSDVKLAVIIF